MDYGLSVGVTLFSFTLDSLDSMVMRLFGRETCPHQHHLVRGISHEEQVEDGLRAYTGSDGIKSKESRRSASLFPSLSYLHTSHRRLQAHPSYRVVSLFIHSTPDWVGTSVANLRLRDLCLPPDCNPCLIREVHFEVHALV